MELELKKLEDLAEAIVSDFAYMKSREKLMRDTNGRKLVVDCVDFVATNVAVTFLNVSKRNARSLKRR